MSLEEKKEIIKKVEYDKFATPAAIEENIKVKYFTNIFKLWVLKANLTTFNNQQKKFKI